MQQESVKLNMSSPSNTKIQATTPVIPDRTLPALPDEGNIDDVDSIPKKKSSKSKNILFFSVSFILIIALGSAIALLLYWYKYLGPVQKYETTNPLEELNVYVKDLVGTGIDALDFVELDESDPGRMISFDKTNELARLNEKLEYFTGTKFEYSQEIITDYDIHLRLREMPITASGKTIDETTIDMTLGVILPDSIANFEPLSSNDFEKLLLKYQVEGSLFKSVGDEWLSLDFTAIDPGKELHFQVSNLRYSSDFPDADLINDLKGQENIMQSSGTTSSVDEYFALVQNAAQEAGTSPEAAKDWLNYMSPILENQAENTVEEDFKSLIPAYNYKDQYSEFIEYMITKISDGKVTSFQKYGNEWFQIFKNDFQSFDLFTDIERIEVSEISSNSDNLICTRGKLNLESIMKLYEKGNIGLKLIDIDEYTDQIDAIKNLPVGDEQPYLTPWYSDLQPIIKLTICNSPTKVFKGGNISVSVNLFEDFAKNTLSRGQYSITILKKGDHAGEISYP